MIQNIKHKLFTNVSTHINSFFNRYTLKYLFSQSPNNKSFISKLNNRSLLILHGP